MPAPVVAAAITVVKKAQLKTLSLLNSGPGSVLIDGNPLANGGTITFNRDSSNIGGDAPGHCKRGGKRSG